MMAALPPSIIAGVTLAPTQRSCRVAVLISGSGSNLKALIDAQHAAQLGDKSLVAVISNRAQAGGLQHASRANILTEVFNLGAFCGGKEAITPEKRREYDAQLAAKLNALAVDLVVLAGWMHIFSPAFLNAVQMPVINLHPALPGQFAGAHGIDDAYAAWQAGLITHTGCMIHEVIEEIDAGKVIATANVPCIVGDTLEDLKHRMHIAEHQLIVQAVRGYGLG
jgi:formyltetrahydrofolate-dependent phosphoribosylglycinamide formyltransferase